MCEELEYSDLLDKAASFSDPYERMAYVAAFAVSSYASCNTRAATKPFNPILGETYECIRLDKGWKFVAEQVGIVIIDSKDDNSLEAASRFVQFSQENLRCDKLGVRPSKLEEFWLIIQRRCNITRRFSLHCFRCTGLFPCYFSLLLFLVLQLSDLDNNMISACYASTSKCHATSDRGYATTDTWHSTLEMWWTTANQGAGAMPLLASFMSALAGVELAGGINVFLQTK